jgi:hypothetical protein
MRISRVEGFLQSVGSRGREAVDRRDIRGGKLGGCRLAPADSLGRSFSVLSLYRSTSARLFGVVPRINRDRAESEDVLQDVYGERIHRRLTDVTTKRQESQNVHPFETFRMKRAARRFISLVLMAILPLQGMSACALSARGPLHTHTAKGPSVVLEDFRRAPAPGSIRPVHIATALGHFHAAGTPLRHYHRFDDASVVAVDDGGLNQSGDSGGLSAGHAAGTIDGMPAAGLSWLPDSGAPMRATHIAWTCMTFEPEPLERPPRPA